MVVYKNVSYTNYADIEILNLFPMYTDVKPPLMVNILSLVEVTSSYDVRTNIKVDLAMYVHAQG